jgi:hypothetical protein
MGFCPIDLKPVYSVCVSLALSLHVRDYLTGTEPQRQGVSALEQSGEQLARSGRELEQQSQPVNALVKQHEHQLQLEKQRTRYHGPTL